jgi:oligoribonuclease NrnB/cAMP/cGMP phosphodiesterase (DHH superfamily)
MKTTVIYHSADYDGIFCREIAKHFLGDKDVEYIGWNFGDAPVTFPSEGRVYVMDLPLDKPFGCPRPPSEMASRVIWIDHHKSAIDSHPAAIAGYRIDGVAACRLAWQWFASKHTGGAEFLARIQDYIDRKVSEPMAVRLAGEYDIWDKRDPGVDTFQYGLRCWELTALDWKQMLRLSERPTVEELEQMIAVGHYYDVVNPDGTTTPEIVWGLLKDGEIVQRYSQKTDADLVTHRSFRLKWEGLDFLCLNTGRFNSLTFAALDKPETGHDALLGFMWNGKVWTVSLYHADHRKDLDLSIIAVKHGGGGHRGACGFTCKALPFQL